MNNPRAELIRTIRENITDFEKPSYIEGLFVETASDLAMAGIDHIRIEASMLRAWVVMQMNYRNPVAVADLLRNFADLVERPVLNSQASQARN